jgi:hypothetical protein
MVQLQVGQVFFAFSANIDAQIYDTWQHYISVWNAGGRGQKAVDMVAVENGVISVSWFIEVKDFRVITSPPKPCNIAGLAGTVAQKVNDTLAGLRHAANNAQSQLERTHARNAIAASRQRIVLHLEPHAGTHTHLFPSGFPANVLQKLKQLAGNIDTHPLVLDIASTPRAGVPWAAS